MCLHVCVLLPPRDIYICAHTYEPTCIAKKILSVFLQINHLLINLVCDAIVTVLPKKGHNIIK